MAYVIKNVEALDLLDEYQRLSSASTKVDALVEVLSIAIASKRTVKPLRQRVSEFASELQGRLNK